jgi:hypothetical protein
MKRDDDGACGIKPRIEGSCWIASSQIIGRAPLRGHAAATRLTWSANTCAVRGVRPRPEIERLVGAEVKERHGPTAASSAAEQRLEIRIRRADRSASIR